MRRRARLAATLAATAAAALALAAAGVAWRAGAARGAEGRYRAVEPIASGRISDKRFVDLDGDGRLDVFAVVGRQARVFLQKENGFQAKPDQVFNFDPRAILYDLGDIDGDGATELVFIATDGVHYYRFESGRFSLRRRHLLDAQPLLSASSDEEVKKKEFLRDFDGDGKLDLIVPEAGRFLVFRGRGDSTFAPPAAIEAVPEAQVSVGSDQLASQLHSIYWFPNPGSGDFDGDGRKDILIEQGGKLAIYLQGAGGTWPPRPSRALDLPFRDAEKDAPRGRFEIDFQTPLQFFDLNGDGRVDFVSTDVGRGSTRIFLSRDGLERLETPDAIVNVGGLSIFHFLIDLDGDGTPDLVIPRVDKPGVWSILKVLLTKTIAADGLVFYNRAKDEGATHLFPERPDVQKEVEVPLILNPGDRGLNVGTTLVINFQGDFDGDGKRDLVVRTGDRTLSVFRAKNGRGLENDAWLTIDCPSLEGFRYVDAQAPDLDGDGKSDLALTYYSWDRDKDKLVLLLSGAPQTGAPKRP